MKDFKSANFPIDGESRTYHVATKPGETANRILTVGDPERARRIAKHLDHIEHEIFSKRAFLTITGTYKGVQISIIAIGMGTPVADMMMREVRAVTKGPLYCVRFGSCGAIRNGKPGAISVAGKGAVMITKNYDYWSRRYENGEGHGTTSTAPYSISSLIPADQELSNAVERELKKELGDEWVLNGKLIYIVDIFIQQPFLGVNATADSFYSSQGRQDISFGDENEKLIDLVLQKYPSCETLEMESGMLLHLAQVANYAYKNVENHPGPIRATACAMIFFNRINNAGISPDYVDILESKAGKAVLEALISM